MSKITFTTEQKNLIVQKIQLYFNDELDQDIGAFDAEFLLDFFSENIGAFYYNQGLLDAETIINKKLEDISDALYEIEKPTEFTR
ncbi:MAG: DUF2164 domain-containing protein [Aquificaceae bacterium]|nr:MAG: DUF2164 domain-containing protein [Aquificaceae bacterium]